MMELPPPPPVSVTIRLTGTLWRVSSTDGLFEGVFVDRRSAVRAANAEAEAHRSSRSAAPVTPP